MPAHRAAACSKALQPRSRPTDAAECRATALWLAARRSWSRHKLSLSASPLTQVRRSTSSCPPPPPLPCTAAASSAAAAGELAQRQAPSPRAVACRSGKRSAHDSAPHGHAPHPHTPRPRRRRMRQVDLHAPRHGPLRRRPQATQGRQPRQQHAAQRHDHRHLPRRLPLPRPHGPQGEGRHRARPRRAEL